MVPPANTTRSPARSPDVTRRACIGPGSTRPGRLGSGTRGYLFVCTGCSNHTPVLADRSAWSLHSLANQDLKKVIRAMSRRAGKDRRGMGSKSIICALDRRAMGLRPRRRRFFSNVPPSQTCRLSRLLRLTPRARRTIFLGILSCGNVLVGYSFDSAPRFTLELWGFRPGWPLVLVAEQPLFAHTNRATGWPLSVDESGEDGLFPSTMGVRLGLDGAQQCSLRVWESDDGVALTVLAMGASPTGVSDLGQSIACHVTVLPIPCVDPSLWYRSEPVAPARPTALHATVYFPAGNRSPDRVGFRRLCGRCPPYGATHILVLPNADSLHCLFLRVCLTGVADAAATSISSFSSSSSSPRTESPPSPVQHDERGVDDGAPTGTMGLPRGSSGEKGDTSGWWRVDVEWVPWHCTAQWPEPHGPAALLESVRRPRPSLAIRATLQLAWRPLLQRICYGAELVDFDARLVAVEHQGAGLLCTAVVDILQVATPSDGPQSDSGGPARPTSGPSLPATAAPRQYSGRRRGLPSAGGDFHRWLSLSPHRHRANSEEEGDCRSRAPAHVNAGAAGVGDALEPGAKRRRVAANRAATAPLTANHGAYTRERQTHQQQQRRRQRQRWRFLLRVDTSTGSAHVLRRERLPEATRVLALQSHAWLASVRQRLAGRGGAGARVAARELSNEAFLRGQPLTQLLCPGQPVAIVR